jgi:hypothetical protein
MCCVPGWSIVKSIGNKLTISKEVGTFGGKHLRRRKGDMILSYVHGYLGVQGKSTLTSKRQKFNPKLFNNNLYSSPSIIRLIKSRRMRLAGHVTLMGEKRNAYRIFAGKPEGKTPLDRPRLWRVDNIKIDLREVGWDGVEWVDMGQDRDQWRTLVNTVLNLRVP